MGRRKIPLTKVNDEWAEHSEARMDGSGTTHHHGAIVPKLPPSPDANSFSSFKKRKKNHLMVMQLPESLRLRSPSSVVLSNKRLHLQLFAHRRRRMGRRLPWNLH